MNEYYSTKENLSTWETEWWQNLPRFSEREWLKVFPQAKNRVKELIKEYEKQAEILSSKIYKNFKKIYKTIKNNPFKVWFWELVVDTFQGERLDKLDKRIKQLRWSLTKKDRTPDITDSQIEVARERDTRELALQDLQKVKRVGQKVIGLCPKHSEKHPSFVVFKDGGWKCFGCGISGANAIDYCIKIRGMNFKEAVKFLT